MASSLIAALSDWKESTSHDGTTPKIDVGFPAEDVGTYLSLLKDLYRVPTVKSATILRNNDIVRLVTEHNDFENDRRVQLETTYSVGGTAEPQQLAPPLPIDRAASAHMTFVSPSGRRRVVFSAVSDDECRVELCEGVACVAMVSAKSIHDNPPKDVFFQQVVWNKDENSIVYVAQPSKKPQYLWGVPKEGTYAAKNRIQEAWGEGLAEVRETTLFRCDFSAKTIKRLEGLPEIDGSVTAPTPIGDTDGLLFSIVPHEKRKLGLLHCVTRPSKTFVWKDGVSTEVYSDLFNARNLHTSPDGKHVAFLSLVDSRAHYACHRLCVAPTADIAKYTVVVDVPEPDACATFPGLYAVPGVDIFWAGNDDIILQSICRSSSVLYRVNTTTKNVTLVSGAQTYGNWGLRDVRGTAVVATYATNIRAPVVRYCADVLAADPKWVDVVETMTSPALIAAAASLVNEVVVRPDLHNTEMIVSAPRDASDIRGTLLLVHGGPHGSDTNNFLPTMFFAVLSRYRLVSVNYGGSAGFGQHQIEALSGRAGTDDVHDVVEGLKGLPGVDLSRVVMMGGSHGGFLTAHVSGQYPDLLRAASMRNPVINVASNYYESDIPDWCEYECATTDLQKMFDASPIAHAHKVKAPTLIALGTHDLRVPPSQGRSWWHALKKHDVDVALFEYPGLGHALDGASCEVDYILQTILFFNKHLA
eukprot:PhM_4_TR1765/c0_g1_i1/m.27405/K01303/APEH; acylaminoacyl-peptidase